MASTYERGLHEIGPGVWAPQLARDVLGIWSAPSWRCDGGITMSRLVGRRRSLVLLAMPLVLGLAACEPVPHPTFHGAQSPASAVTFRLLSGDASQAVVTATAAGQCPREDQVTR